MENGKAGKVGCFQLCTVDKQSSKELQTCITTAGNSPVNYMPGKNILDRQQVFVITAKDLDNLASYKRNLETHILLM